MGDGTDIEIAPVLDRPYTAILESRQSYQSPTGETLQHVSRAFQARDRFGRTRSEGVNGGMTVGGEMLTTEIVLVSDPVSHCQFHWTQLANKAALPEEDRVAFVTCGSQTLRYKDLKLIEMLDDTALDGTTVRGDTTIKIEHLVPLQLNGLAVHRRRVSNSDRDASGQVKQWSSETWYSPELNEIIRWGDNDMLTEIQRINPDSRLFYPPEGYRIELQPKAEQSSAMH